MEPDDINLPSIPTVPFETDLIRSAGSDTKLIRAKNTGNGGVLFPSLLSLFHLDEGVLAERW